MPAVATCPDDTGKVRLVESTTFGNWSMPFQEVPVMVVLDGSVMFISCNVSPLVSLRMLIALSIVALPPEVISV